MNPFWALTDFVRQMRRRMRFGELSRAGLRMLRLEWSGDTLECEWIARPADPWDAGSPAGVAERNQTVQALQDAMKIRDLVFETLTEVNSAKFRVYRQSGAEAELIITGTVAREDEPAPRLSSVVMRAKLCGLRFWLADEVLGRVQSEG